MPDEQVEQLTNEIYNFFNRFVSWETAIIRSSDLALSESHAIELLGIYGKMNMKTLAERLTVTRGTVTVTVDRLEKSGYAKRSNIEEDRRAYIIELTPEGHKAFEEHHKHHLRLTEELVTLLSDAETETLLRILQRLNAELF
jgi:DNA-binding MarR family transcriptional regulator